jgi:APA family basic amino acid/polyamine antiporter
LLTWLSFSLKSAFAILGMATVLKAVLPGPVEVWAVGLCWVFVGLNLLGAKQAGRTQVVIVAVILASMVLYVSRGLPSVRLDNLIPFAPRGVGALVSTAALIFISYGGLLKVAGVAEEVQNPAKNLPLGMMLSLSAVLVLYILVALVTAGLVPPSRLAGALTPLSDGARLLGGTGAGVVMSVVALLALFSAANAGIMASTRYPLALARDGLLPPALARVSERFRTPHVSLLVTGAVMAGAVLIRLTTLVKAASTVFIFIYAFSCLSVVILRESRLQNYQPRFSAPLYPLFQVMAFLAMGSSSRPLVAKHFWWALPPRRGRYPSTGSTGVSGPARSMLFSISSNA